MSVPMASLLTFSSGVKAAKKHQEEEWKKHGAVKATKELIKKFTSSNTRMQKVEMKREMSTIYMWVPWMRVMRNCLMKTAMIVLYCSNYDIVKIDQKLK